MEVGNKTRKNASITTAVGAVERLNGEQDRVRFQNVMLPHLADAYALARWLTGNRADAEDVVQEAFLRWLDADHAAVREPEAFLRRVVTRLCLDQLKSARHRHETYVGPWLPEPVLDAPEDDLEDITLPLMLALERLSPLERAAFLLRDVFGRQLR